jgi:hypothetical protein
MNCKVAIHQPNFFPWLGLFHKISVCDYFVFLDHVQFPKKKTGGVWGNRVKLIINNKAEWCSAVYDRKYHGFRSYNEMRFKSDIRWREDFFKNININYRKHPNYDETINTISEIILNPENSISEYNINAITKICSLIGINNGKLRRSSLLPHEGKSNIMNCSITKLLGGNIYLSGDGADGYQDESIYKKNNINLHIQNFTHPVYPQLGLGDFVPGLSVIDAAMNLGWGGVAKLLNTGQF